MYSRSPPPSSTTTARWSPSASSNCSPDGGITRARRAGGANRDSDGGAPRRRPRAQEHGDSGRGRVDRRQPDACVVQRADAERGDPVAHLVEGDHAPGDSCRPRRQLRLPEADRQRQERGAPEPGEPEREDPERGGVVRQRGDEDERAGEHERQQVVRQARGEPPLDRGEHDSPHRHHPPERGERQRCGGHGRADVRRHVELGPVAVDGLAHAVEEREACVDPETGGDPSGRRARSGASRLDAERQAHADEHEDDEEGRRHERHALPEADPEEDRHEHGRQDRSEPEQGVEDEDRAVRRSRMERRRERVQRRHRQAEAAPQERGGEEEESVGEGLVRREELADDQQRHGNEARDEPGEVDALDAEAPAQAPAEERGGNRRDHLRHEQPGVLRAREVVLAGSVRIVLAAGNVTSAMPCAMPAP